MALYYDMNKAPDLLFHIICSTTHFKIFVKVYCVEERLLMLKWGVSWRNTCRKWRLLLTDDKFSAAGKNLWDRCCKFNTKSSDTFKVSKTTEASAMPLDHVRIHVAVDVFDFIA